MATENNNLSVYDKTTIPNAKNFRFGIVVSEWNSKITEGMFQGAFDAIIDSDKKVITISLVSNLSSNQGVYVAIGATVEDSYNNAISEASAVFTTGDRLPPTVTIQAVKASST